MTTSLKGVSSMKLHRDLGVTQSTAWFMAHRIREAWAAASEDPFFGPVEADETYVGGKAKNMHGRRRREVIEGRGPVGKTAVVGVKDRASNKVVARPVADTSAATLVPMVADCHTARSGCLHRRAPLLQAARVARLRPRRGCPQHPRVRPRRRTHQRYRVAVVNVQTRLRRHLPSDVRGTLVTICGRVHWAVTTSARWAPRDQMGSVAVGMVGKRLRYDDLITA